MRRMSKKLEYKEKEVFWKDRRRTIFGLPLSFTRYKLYEDKLIISKGFFSITEDEIMLFRMLDFQVKMTFFQRIFGVGTIVVSSSDSTHKDFEILSIKQPREVKQLLSERVLEERKKHRVRGFDNIGASHCVDDIDDIDDLNDLYGD